MVSRPTNNYDESPRRPPGTTPEVRETQLVDLAINLAEQQLRQGTASAQVISYYLKLGSSRELLEQERLRHENELLQAKTKQIDQLEEIARLSADAIRAMKSYQGAPPEELDRDEEY